MSNLQSSVFKVEREGALVHLMMNRPDKANAMNKEFWHDLPRLLQELGEDTSVRCVILSGEGKHFSAGMDLAAFSGPGLFSKNEPGRAAHALRKHILKLQDAFSAIERVPFPVIAAIHGACIGGAIDLITACDIRLASDDAYFAVEEINIGMAADVGTLQRLPKLISPSIAAELCYSGRRFNAAQAHGYGLVSQTFSNYDTLLDGAKALGEEIIARSPLAISGIKSNLLYSRDHSVADGLDYIATWNGGMLRQEDLMNALQAKVSKQQAVFKDLTKIE